MNHEALASKAADAVGVTPHSDMRLFVEQAVKWALKEAALSAAEPVAFARVDDDGRLTMFSTNENAGNGMYPMYKMVPLYAAPPAPSVAVKALEWDEFSTELKRHFQSNTILGQYQIAYLGEFECWQLYSPQKSSTWKENFSRHKSSDEAKAAAQSDYEARIRSALSAQVQDVAGWQLVPKELTPAMVRNLQMHTKMGAYVCENLSGAYSLMYEYHRAMLAAAPAKQEG